MSAKVKDCVEPGVFVIEGTSIKTSDFELQNLIRAGIIQNIGAGSGYLSDYFLQCREGQETAKFLDKLIDLAPEGLSSFEVVNLLENEKFMNEHGETFKQLIDDWHHSEDADNPYVDPLDRGQLEGFEIPPVGEIDPYTIFFIREDVRNGIHRYTDKFIRTINEACRLSDALTRQGKVPAHNKRLWKLLWVLIHELEITKMYNKVVSTAYANGNGSEVLYMNDMVAAELMTHGRGGMISLDFSRVGNLNTIIVGGFAWLDNSPIKYDEPMHQVIRGIMATGLDLHTDISEDSARPLFGASPDNVEDESLFTF